MTVTWTDAARRELDAALGRLGKSLAGTEADAEEVTGDLRRHVEEEAAARGLPVVTEEDVRAILAGLGAGGTGQGDSPPDRPTRASSTADAPATKSRGRVPALAATFLWPFGVVLPLVALILELVQHLCVQDLFDPLPTKAHVILVAVVPLANLAALLALRSHRQIQRWLLFANGLALGVAFYYALVFAPLVPISVLAIMAYGLGLLSLAPMFAVICGLALRVLLREHAAAPGWTVLIGFCAGVLLLIVAGLPRAVTRYSLAQAVEGTPAERVAAVERLRTFGDREILLRACYERGGEMADLESFLMGSHDVMPTDARAVYYRVTGEPFNSVPPPKLAGLRSGSLFEGSWDEPEQGGPAVGGVTKGLSLLSSRIDGSLDPSAALGYLEWTLQFKNTGEQLAEARAVIALPPGSAVSRATLWIDGKEQEAAFGSRAATGQAYENVVRVRRDPLLVTTAGPDRVLVQCYPVPAGGTMKIRLGVTAPLTLDSRELARLFLPHFVERNFHIDGDLRHGLWIEAKGALDSAPGLAAERTPAGGFAVRGDRQDAELATTTIAAHRDPALLDSWAKDPVEAQFDVLQRLEPSPAMPASAVVVVLDGSKGLAGEAAGLDAVLGVSSPAPHPTVLVAGDELEEAAPGSLRSNRFRGGTDNVPALVRAWDIAAGNPHGLVIWVHAAQPMELGTVEALAQRCDRRPDGPRLIALAARPGPNRVLDRLDGCRWLSVAPRRGKLEDDLRALLSGASPDGATWRARRERVQATAGAETGAMTSAHLVRLWALDEIRDSRYLGVSAASKAALAIRYQLVTPLSGAVVLETAQEVERAGLEPGSPQAVPIIPEPATAALLGVAALLLGLTWLRGRRRATAR